MPIPPAAVACTSDSGASASAATYSAQPPSPATNPTTQRRWANSAHSEKTGRRSESGGRRDAAPCWTT
jgi:hypothetical protein